MKHLHQIGCSCFCSRRDFLKTVGATTGNLVLLSGSTIRGGQEVETSDRKKGIPTVRGAFVYPPSKALRDAGYWSWPGSSFNAEGHQKKYMAQIRVMEKELGMRISMDDMPLDDNSSVTRFIAEVQRSQPDALLLIPFKKGHWGQVTRIIEEVKLPTVVLATLGVLLVDHIIQIHRKPGVYLISAMDDLNAVRYGMKMIRTARRMRESCLLNLVRSEPKESVVPQLGTVVRNVPLEQFYSEFKDTETTDPVKELAQSYLGNARETVEPTEEDVVDSARAYFALKALLKREKGDAIMMDCLPGLKRPHQHVPPCMGFMTLRDEGIPAGCQADLNAVLSLMLVQHLFDRPGFQQNASMQTEGNHYFGAHCTSPSKMNGIDAPPEPYILRSHAEAGWGCVPQVLFTPGQEVTLTQYFSGKEPHMLIYSGKVVRCYPKAAGGCRTNIEMTINEVDDVCDVKGMHQTIFYGNNARRLRTFCQLYGIKVVS